MLEHLPNDAGFVDLLEISSIRPSYLGTEGMNVLITTKQSTNHAVFFKHQHEGDAFMLALGERAMEARKTQAAQASTFADGMEEAVTRIREGGAGALERARAFLLKSGFK